VMILLRSGAKVRHRRESGLRWLRRGGESGGLDCYCNTSGQIGGKFERRDMAEGSLISKLDAALTHLRVVEHERNEAFARAAALEQEIKELRGLISMAESKAEEILRGSPISAAPKPEVSFPQPVSPPPAPEVKAPVPAAAFQDFTEKAPIQNPADTRRRYTQVF
jgi:hypothetical protein